MNVAVVCLTPIVCVDGPATREARTEVVLHHLGRRGWRRHRNSPRQETQNSASVWEKVG